MPKIALIQPDSPYLSTPLAFPSLGLLYISAYLKEAGFNPDFYDLTGGRKLPEIETDVAAFSCQITQWEQVKELKKKVKAKQYVIGGAFPTHTYCKGFLNVCGEGEQQMLEIVKGTFGQTGYVDPNFFPDWEAIDLSRYGYLLEGKKCINIMTKRGNCPYHCAFCAKQETGRSPLRFRTARNVLAEIDYLRGKGFGAVAIYDDDVLINKKRDREIFEGLAQRGMPYRCMTRTNLATKDDLKMLKNTGCAEVAVGIETADPKIHETIKKGTTLEQDAEFMRNAKEVGLRVKAYLIIGLPGENRESVKKTRIWLRKHRPENYDLSIFTPYPGSDIYNNKENYDIDWDEKELRNLWFSGKAQYDSCAVKTSKISSSMILHCKRAIDEEFKRGKGGSTSYWRPI